ncbi:MAG: hypothetical protein HN732_21065 [Rhodospirillaceae bacterium]|jgi:hypothetical protein|nr:hypothetical protein [Rhodospirillaceae bacterium]
MKRHRLLPLLTVICFSYLLTACESPLQEVSYPELRFSHLPPIQINVARIDIVEQFRSPLRAPHVEHELPLTPAQAMRNWATDRLRAVGTSGQAKFIIVDASVKAQQLRKKKGLKATFTLDQAARYNTRLEARLEIETAGGLGQGFATATATRQRTMPEAASINDRDDALYRFIESAAQDFDRVMAANIDRHLAPFKRAP